MSRKNGKKNKDLHVVLPKIPELAVCRYTFDSWKRCYPGSSYRDYENEQCPDNLMDSLALEFDSWSDEELEQYQDTRICPVLIDEDYFSWLGGQGKYAGCQEAVCGICLSGRSGSRKEADGRRAAPFVLDVCIHGRRISAYTFDEWLPEC